MKSKKTFLVSSPMDYFRFSRSHRRALFFTFSIFVFAAAIIRMVSPSESIPNVEAEEVIAQIEVALQPSVKSENNAPNLQRYPGYRSAPRKKVSVKKAEVSFTTGMLDYFDPNTASAAELMALGLREKAVTNLVNYREKGGRFRAPQDLGKLYSLKKEEVETLLPYVKISTEKADNSLSTKANPALKTEGMPVTSKPANARPSLAPMDVNLADSAMWTLLPGIGAKRAAAIVNFRSKLGGFSSVDQVGETFGLPDSVFQKIKPFLTWHEANMEKICLNAASESQLKGHPYIGWQMARLIVAYRKQHGSFKQVDDLLKIHVVEKNWLERVRPYLKTSES